MQSYKSVCYRVLLASKASLKACFFSPRLREAVPHRENARRAGNRRQQQGWEEEKMRRELQAQWLGRVRHHGVSHRGNFFINPPLLTLVGGYYGVLFISFK